MNALGLSTVNPFATRYTRPGALPFLFPPGLDAGQLVERLQANGWRGQIIGPHGTGKSTLLATLLPELRRAGREPLLITLHDGTRRFPRADRHLLRAEAGPNRLILIDGYEQLSLGSRWALRWQCRRTGAGLLVTAHQPVGLPDLYRTAVSPALGERVVEQLLHGRGGRASAAGVEPLLAAHGGNLREVLFALYDRYESAQRRPART